MLLGDYSGDVNELLNNYDPSMTAAQLIGLPVADAGVAPVEEKKERKKRTHDPNAPKRPLTPYFLYMQHARSIIANDLGAEAPKGAVQEEGQRRWANMTPDEKLGWNNAYQYNLRLYNARVHSYKAENPDARDMTDEQALKYANDFGIPMPEVKDASKGGDNVQAAIAEQLQDDSAKTPKKSGGGRKRKSDAPTTEIETPKANPASPDKKRRRTSTKGPADDKDDSKKSARKKTKSS